MVVVVNSVQFIFRGGKGELLYPTLNQRLQRRIMSLETAGFQLIKIVPTQSMLDVIESVPV